MKSPNVQSENIIFETVTLPNGKQLELNFRLERPTKGDGPFSVVFFVYGGAWVKGNKSGMTDQAPVLADYLLLPE